MCSNRTYLNFLGKDSTTFAQKSTHDLEGRAGAGGQQPSPPPDKDYRAFRKQLEVLSLQEKENLQQGDFPALNTHRQKAMLKNDFDRSAGPEGEFPLIMVLNPLAGQDGTKPSMQVYRPMYPGDFEVLLSFLLVMP